MILFFFGMLLFTLWLYFRIVNKRHIEISANVPGWPQLPLIGNAHQFFSRKENNFKTMKDLFEFAERNGGLAKLWLGPRLYYVVCDPSDVEALMKVCFNRDYLYEFGRRWVGDGIFTANMELWKKNIKKISPTFNQNMIKNFIGIFNEYGRSLASDMRKNANNGPYNAAPVLQTATLKIICKTAMGLDFFTDSQHDFKKVYEAVEFCFSVIQTRVLNYHLHFDCIFDMTDLSKQYSQAIKMLRDMADSILVAKLKKKGSDADANDAETQQGYKAFLDYLLELNANGDWCTQSHMIDEILTVIVAGQETSALETFYSMLIISTYPDVQQRLYNELQSVMGDSDRDFTKEDLDKLVYMEAVIKEVMRLLPIAPFLARYIHTDVKLRNCIAPAGASFYTGPWQVQRSKAIWGEDAEEFVPDRWLQPERIPKQICAYGPFGFGRRICLGRYYAMVAMKIFLGHTLRSVKLEGDWKKLTLKLDVMIRPATDQYMNITLR